MNKLDKIVVIKGIQIPGLTATLVKRTERVAMYLREDGYYEVGILQILPAQIVFGKPYPERERYWYTEEFGVVAKTTSDLKRAEEHYNDFVEHLKSLKKNP